LHKILN
jgi:serine/threonine protein kinase